MNYKNTLNLPQTKFPMRANLSREELKIKKKWETEDIYDLLRKKREGKPKYILHDGPPYANGHIHIGHCLNKILKDIILKYKTMRGFNTPFIVGWDCHGLPVEHQLFKRLKIDKGKISQLEFRKKAKDYALKFVHLQKEEFKRLGVFADWENSYQTMDKRYEFKIIQAFNRLFKQGYIYRDLKPVYWCPDCETALAEAEVEYKDISSPSVYVKFKLQPSTFYSQPLSLLIWTTTPWTLPANVAIAVHSRAKYALVKIRRQNTEDRRQRTEDRRQRIEKRRQNTEDRRQRTEDRGEGTEYRKENAEYKRQNIKDRRQNTGDRRQKTEDGMQEEVLLIAEDLVNPVMQKAGIEDYEVIRTTKGEELEGLEYEHLWLNRVSKIVLADFVDLKQGTGCVHIAPGHGVEDYEVGLKYKLPVISPVNEQGKFNSDVLFFKGMNVFEANKVITTRLQDMGMLLPIEEEILHSYPHCWRCKKEVIFRATKQWFIKVDHRNLREKSVGFTNTQIDWVPSWGKKRMASMLLLRPDWCLSRQRYWGVPIPVFYCVDCGKELTGSKILDKIERLIEKEGVEGWFEHSAEEILAKKTVCPKCSCQSFTKGKDILDVWFDSGVSHYAVLQERECLSYPADLYLEGSDQHRGWFQSSLLTAMALNDNSPFKAVLTHGFVVDGEGRKMSKSLGNVISPQEIINKRGADVLRLWAASADYNEDIKISSAILDSVIQSYRRIRNTVRFLLSNLFDFNPQKDKIDYNKLMEIDKWALLETHILLREVNKGYEKFQFHKVCQLIQNFCTVKMSTLYLDILKDRLYTFAKDSVERRAAQTSLYQILLTLTKVIAPILNFTAEEIWGYIPDAKEESVHLCSWPSLGKRIDKGLEEKWDRLFEVRTKVCEA
ncbi:MAG: isoleucine--tRNA ligase, partial [Candidatus Omnitrophica bacterium]|nr:isoleucine--tRNA ligase [Candidatus Omnitrophota bacterium]